MRLSDHHRSNGPTLSAFSRRRFGGRNQSPIGVNFCSGIVVGGGFRSRGAAKIGTVLKPYILLITWRKLREEDL